MFTYFRTDSERVNRVTELPGGVVDRRERLLTPEK